ncbi:RND family efflux transporter, MFP subunit [Rhodoblastus acidophilus]|uniref:RND family efflux transporter, MFP subunit n=1 Tax=Rhodoblastus acidophilus TaxID=1074 RepID=A0A212R3M0_RHOAC|nr:efflux RND transporter periplasmic adaptor subunit [Rhodoblastus acidophilus]MCW2314759.1 RND family efflux transporter MFP subunit [Rhodoblastus acidophilus]PPQ40242.1 efflux RND transporter periplasmic adaptor subunit [Rhodoblastus acidophilus]RAI18146.1 efflux RND transporter periplasmic adaptor subunit [Rhodoblastus acidophilus]SNB66597.1 RND family efflux transporter, MFP subunit [Rhodoblastus acidophilus]
MPIFGSNSGPYACAAALCLALSGCGDDAKSHANPPLNVVAQKISLESRERELVLSGAVRARVQAELSFRVSGRVIARKGDVGQRVQADAVLAELDPSEQEADLRSANAGLAGAEASWRQAKATYDRQKSLLASGFTTQASYEQADQALRGAVGSLDAAKAQVASAQDALSYTKLLAGHDGVITARNIEVGQVAQAAQAAFSFAEDGPRDAVFAMYETPFSHPPDSNDVELALIADPQVTARGHIREISPVIDPRTGTIQAKVQIDADQNKFPLGAAVIGRVIWRMADVVVLPWSALASASGKPAVWTVDPASSRIGLRPVTVASYESEYIVVKDGLKPGELVVAQGGKFLRENQIVRVQNQEALQ